VSVKHCDGGKDSECSAEEKGNEECVEGWCFISAVRVKLEIRTLFLTPRVGRIGARVTPRLPTWGSGIGEEGGGSRWRGEHEGDLRFSMF